MKESAKRTVGQAELGADGLVIRAGDVPEREGEAVFVGEASKDGENGFAPFISFHRLIGLLFAASNRPQLDIGSRGSGTFLSQVMPGCIGHNAAGNSQKPGSEAIRVSQLIQRAISEQKRFLSQILGFVRIADFQINA